MKRGYEKIKRTHNKQFEVTSFGANGEPLRPSETFHRLRTAIANSLAQMRVYNGTDCIVRDMTGEREVRYMLFADGEKKIIE